MVVGILGHRPVDHQLHIVPGLVPGQAMIGRIVEPLVKVEAADVQPE